MNTPPRANKGNDGTHERNPVKPTPRVHSTTPRKTTIPIPSIIAGNESNIPIFTAPSVTQTQERLPRHITENSVVENPPTPTPFQYEDVPHPLTELAIRQFDSQIRGTSMVDNWFTGEHLKYTPPVHLSENHSRSSDAHLTFNIRPMGFTESRDINRINAGQQKLLQKTKNFVLESGTGHEGNKLCRCGGGWGPHGICVCDFEFIELAGTGL
ncbi:hypothetical protein RUND412_004215 [Rhizina undulata]